MISCSSNAGAIESQDRFTSLPDCLTSTILSRLPTKEAAKTCVLSKEWKYKWPSICDIDVDSVLKSLRRNSRLIKNFHKFLDRILEFNRDLRISSFIVQDNSSQDRKTSWISKIVNQHVEDLTIEASSRNRKIELRSLVHTTEFKLPCDHTLIVSVENSFPNLKKLCLRGKDGAAIQILNEQSRTTGELSLSFPVLEVLTLERYNFLNVKFVEINAPELKFFTAQDPCSDTDYVIKMSAVRLEWFSWSGCHLEFDLYAPSLYSIELRHQFVSCGPVASRAMSLLNSAPTLKCLTLSSSVVQALAERKKVHVLNTFGQLEQLTLYDSTEKPMIFDIKSLMELLHATPRLQTLSLFIYDYSYVPLQEPLLPYIVSQDSQLKEVSFYNFNGENSQIGLTKLFLEKITGLKRVLIDTCSEELKPHANIRRSLCKLLLTNANIMIEASSRNRKIVVHRLFQLTEFKLPCDRTLIVAVESYFPNLKSLCLGGNDGGTIQILNEQSLRTGQILLSFPVLNYLKLEHYEFLNVEFVEINAPELTVFRVKDPYNPNDYVIKMSAPKLYCFESSGCNLNKFDLYAPSLNSVDLKHDFVLSEIGETEATRAVALLNRTPSLTYLTLSPSIVQALAEWKNVCGHHSHHRFGQLKKLRLSSMKGSAKKPTMFDTKGLMELLQATPHLESLTLSMYDYKHVPVQEPLPTCIVSQDSQLKEVTVFHFIGGSNQIDMAQLFLEKATKLERMLIRPTEERKMCAEIRLGLYKLTSKLSGRLKVCWCHDEQSYVYSLD